MQSYYLTDSIDPAKPASVRHADRKSDDVSEATEQAPNVWRQLHLESNEHDGQNIPWRIAIASSFQVVTEPQGLVKVQDIAHPYSQFTRNDVHRENCSTYRVIGIEFERVLAKTPALHGRPTCGRKGPMPTAPALGWSVPQMVGFVSERGCRMFNKTLDVASQAKLLCSEVELEVLGSGFDQLRRSGQDEASFSIVAPSILNAELSNRKNDPQPQISSAANHSLALDEPS